MIKFKTLLICLFCCISFNLWAADNALTEQQFMHNMVQKHQFKAEKIKQWFAKAERDQSVINLMNKPYEGKPWYIYQKHFLSSDRINKGVKFWRKYRSTLQHEQDITGVPAQIIVAIIGVESKYGARKGSFPAFDTLYTLAFHYPKRARFFQRELEQYLLLCREQEWDPFSITGSYAGALGQPQFMPSSYRAYAKAYKHEKNINLFDFEPDVIASVANYFYKHHWQRGEPIATPVTLTKKATSLPRITREKGNFSKNKHSMAEFKHLGVIIPAQYPLQLNGWLFQVQEKSDTKDWLAFHNFYVITRYNKSILYALAAYQLASAIQRKYQAQYHS